MLSIDSKEERQKNEIYNDAEVSDAQTCTAEAAYRKRKCCERKAGGGVKQKTVFEIGYGAGEIFNLYRSLGMQAEGFDFSKAAYQYASCHYQREGVVLHQNMPKPQKKFDYVIACEVLEHIRDDVGAVREWKSYLKSTGKMIVSVPAHKKRWGESDVYAGHFRRYERRELVHTLKKAGMRVEKIYNYNFPVCFLLDFLRDRNSKKKLSEKKLNREGFTKNSGIDRDFHPIVLALSHPALWMPVIKLEELFYRTDLGSAYILIASFNCF